MKGADSSRQGQFAMGFFKGRDVGGEFRFAHRVFQPDIVGGVNGHVDGHILIHNGGRTSFTFWRSGHQNDVGVLLRLEKSGAKIRFGNGEAPFDHQSRGRAAQVDAAVGPEVVAAAV
jgi:hypothetical protein